MAAKSEKPKAAGARSTSKATASRATTTRRKAQPAITDEMVAERAYHLHLADPGASDVDNWLRAEAELRGA
jgi:hypothetical protein